MTFNEANMFCPKCKRENLDTYDICFYCGYELPANDGIYIAIEKNSIHKWKPKYVDIHLPKEEGSVRLSFLKPPFIDGNKLRVRHKGVDGRVRNVSDLSTEKLRDMIQDIIGAINEIS